MMQSHGQSKSTNVVCHEHDFTLSLWIYTIPGNEHSWSCPSLNYVFISTSWVHCTWNAHVKKDTGSLVCEKLASSMWYAKTQAPCNSLWISSSSSAWQHAITVFLPKSRHCIVGVRHLGSREPANQRQTARPKLSTIRGATLQNRVKGRDLLYISAPSTSANTFVGYLLVRSQNQNRRKQRICIHIICCFAESVGTEIVY